MDIESLVIETTRRCNLSCNHCLRGRAQAMDMNSGYLHDLFSQVDNVSSICFSGGEPSLAPHIIEEAIRVAKLYGTTFNNFYIATNAVVVPDEFLLAIMSLWLFCDDNEISSVHWSNDKHHDDVPGENIEKLEAFRFVGKKYPRGDDGEKYLINEGNAAENGLGQRDNHPSSFDIEFDGISSHVREESIYLNCKGNIIAGCEWSYETQDSPERIVCHVKDLTLDKIEEYANE